MYPAGKSRASRLARLLLKECATRGDERTCGKPDEFAKCEFVALKSQNSIQPVAVPQFAQQRAFGGRSVQPGVRPQQYDRIGQRCQVLSQPQAMEKPLSQSQLVFLAGLSQLNQKVDPLQQPPGRQC